MKYLRISKNRILVNFQYRFNTLLGIFTYLFSFIVVYFMWNNIYQNENQILSYTKKEMIAYIFIVNMMHYIYNFTDLTRLADMEHSGSFTINIIRPIDIKKESFFHYLGEKFFKILVIIIGILIFAIIFKNIYLPLTLILFILSFYMCFNLEQVFSCFGFWMLETWPLIGVINGIYYILSGSTFPLDILPDKIYKLLMFNPFSIIGYALTKSIQNKLSLKMNIIYILASIFWIIIFELIYRHLLNKGLKKYEGMGA